MSEDLRHTKGGGQESITALAMVLAAISLGYALSLSDGFYSKGALLWLTFALGFCFAPLAMPSFSNVERFTSRILAPAAAAAGIAIQTGLDISRSRHSLFVSGCLAIIFLFGVLQLFDLRKFSLPAAAVMAAAFLCAGVAAIKNLPDPAIDVYTLQQAASAALTHGKDPYKIRIRSPYEAGSPNYGQGLVDSKGYLAVGFPYPPLSLIMVLPALLAGGDVRLVNAAAMSGTAVLMALAAPRSARRLGGLAAALFLTTPCALYVLRMAWTEPLLVLNFSLMMFCACRWRKGLPWALGLFLSTKQYSVLALPLLPLLIEGPGFWKELRSIVARAASVVAAINAPFFLWGPRDFLRSVVMLPFWQRFRTDALTYLVWAHSGAEPPKAAIWIGLSAAALSAFLALRRCKHSASSFAAMLALVTALFFAFNKQAFCNYYYFVIAAACWSVAAAGLPLASGGAVASQRRGSA